MDPRSTLARVPINWGHLPWVTRRGLGPYASEGEEGGEPDPPAPPPGLPHQGGEKRNLFLKQKASCSRSIRSSLARPSLAVGQGPSILASVT